MKKNLHLNSLEAFEGTPVTRSERQEKVHATLLAGGPMTDREVMQALGFTDMNAVRPRITELVDAFWCVECGRVEDPTTGKKVRRVRAMTEAERTAAIESRRRRNAQDFPVHAEQLALAIA
jgi:hypothetical protein